MALLYLKNTVLGRSRHSAGYSPLAPGSPSMDPESGLLTTTVNGNGGEQKLTLLPSSASTASSNSSDSKSPTSSLFSGTRINPRIISDATIGLSDGLTVPFALTAGLSALGDTKVVIYGGLAELIAGGISMGLGGYLGAKSEAEAYAAALAETKGLVEREPETAGELVRGVLGKFGLGERVLGEVVEGLFSAGSSSTRERKEVGEGEKQGGELGEDGMVEFLMRFHHQLAEADYAPSRAYVSGLTISLGYFFGGLVPLLPYLFVGSVDRGFGYSVVVMAVALFIFGWAKTVAVGEAGKWTCFRSGVQMVVLGGVAAGAAMGCVKAIGS